MRVAGAGGRSAHLVLVSRQHGPVDAAVTVHERAVCPGLVVTLDHQPGHAVVGTELAAHGIEVSLPSGWEGRVFRRPAAGEVASADAGLEGEPAAPAETTHAVLHVSTIALPLGIGDFASGAVEATSGE